MDNKVIRLAILGCGFAAQQIHVPRLLRMKEHFRITAVADMKVESAEKLAEEIGCRYFSDLKTMLENVKVDALVILTPLHTAAIKTALEHNLDVFVEKPLCEDLEEAYHIVGSAVRANQILMVGAMRIFDPAIKRAQEIINQIKPLRWVEIRDYCGAGSVVGDGDLVASSFQTGLKIEKEQDKNLLQALLLEFIHDISILRGIWQGPINVLDTWPAADGWSLSGQLLLPGNTPCVFAFAEFGVTSAPVFDVSLRVFGENGCVEINFGDANLNGQCRTLITSNYHEVEEIISDPFTDEWLAFEQAVKKRSTPLNSGKDGLFDLELAWNIFNRSKKGF